MLCGGSLGLKRGPMRRAIALRLPGRGFAAIEVALGAMTSFDERDINRIFTYDDEAYGEVKRNLGRLIGLG
jgi:hypothetical protein